MSIGGSALFKGIYLQSDIKNCAMYANGKYIIKENSTHKVFKLFECSFFKNFPFIRQIPYFYKNKILCILPLLIICTKVSILGLHFTIFSIVLLIIILILILLYFKIGKIRKWHGAEHKVVNCIEHSKNLSLDNVKKESCVNIRCGSTLGIILLILFSISSMIPYSILFTFMSVFIALEIYDTRNKYLIFKPLFWLSIVFQQYIITCEPSDRELLIAINCMKLILRGNK